MDGPYEILCKCPNMKEHILIIIFSFLVDILNDPRFLNCINEMDIVNHPAKLMPAYARCASVIGRPRYILTKFQFCSQFPNVTREMVLYENFVMTIPVYIE